MTGSVAAGESTEPELVLTDDQRELAKTLRQFLQSTWDPQRLTEAGFAAPELARQCWNALDQAIGVAGVTVPQKCSGAGAGVGEMCVIAEELGRALHPSPWLSLQGFAIPLLAADVEHPARAALLEAVATNQRIITAAWTGSTLEIRRYADGTPVVSGVVNRVVDADAAGSVLVLVGKKDQMQLLAIDLDAPGVTRHPRSTLDLARSQATVTLVDCKAVDLGPVDDVDVARGWTLARIAAAAELLGVADHAMETAVDYAKQRSQFGRLIGSYQAVKHRCARLLIDVEQARSLLRYAAWCADSGHADLEVAAGEAWWMCSTTAVQGTADLIRVLGGTGFTWEHTAHLYFRRARATTALFGDPHSTLDDLGRGLQR
ncbi:acyl-CoA dehydrogenase family protein [Mycobacterium sp. RTGN4]|uniref:acyl-CoA dehydrogenase family protein n=1 Tax=Mycobacterium sp. RTGN4 TaxID=3016523 RepID=UPI0029C6740D|nr:acyl-CoA dehydrogenase family protein [Mycobacterium sp. RTGN4]